MPKFFSMSFMMFMIIYIYTTVRDTKDTLVVSTCGAESITFLKVRERDELVRKCFDLSTSHFVTYPLACVTRPAEQTRFFLVRASCRLRTMQSLSAEVEERERTGYAHLVCDRRTVSPCARPQVYGVLPAATMFMVRPPQPTSQCMRSARALCNGMGGQVLTLHVRAPGVLLEYLQLLLEEGPLLRHRGALHRLLRSFPAVSVLCLLAFHVCVV
eukprot:3185781-Rhodomonas_salina.1